MTDCSKIPTLTLVEESKKAMEDVKTVVKSSQITYESELTGEVGYTLTGLNQLFGGINVGDYVNGTVLNEVWEYAYNPATGYGYKVKSKSSLPYAIDATTYPDPEDDPNLKRVSDVNHEDVTKAQEELLPLGSKIYPRSGYLANGMSVTTGTTHLRVLVGGETTIVAMSPVANGVVSLLTEVGATVGGVNVEFSKSAIELRVDDVNFLKGINYASEGDSATIINQNSRFVWKSGDMSPYVSQDANNTVWVAPSSDQSGASGAWERLTGSIFDNLTFELAGDLDTRNKAYNFFAKYFPATEGLVVEVRMPTGYTEAEQISIYGKNASFIKFTSVDAVVPVSPSVWAGSISESGYIPCVVVRFGATAYFDIVYDAQETGLANDNKAGYLVRTGSTLLSSGTVDSHAGFKNLNGRGCYVVQNASAQVNYGDFSGCWQGLRCSNMGRAQIRNGNVQNCKSFGLMCDNGNINASSINGDDCNSFAISTNGGVLMAINSFARNTTTNSAQVVDNGSLIATDADFSNGGPLLIATGGDVSANRLIHSGVSGDAIDARTNSTVAIPSSNLSGSTTGIRARFGSKVEATGLNASGCGVGVNCEGGEVYLDAADGDNSDLTGCGTAILITQVGVVRGYEVDVSGATVTGVNAGSGGEGKFHSIIANNCNRPLQATTSGKIWAEFGSALNATLNSRVLTGGEMWVTGLDTGTGGPDITDFDGAVAFNQWTADGIIHAAV